MLNLNTVAVYLTIIFIITVNKQLLLTTET